MPVSTPISPTVGLAEGVSVFSGQGVGLQRSSCRSATAYATDFSRVMHMADIHGRVVILKDNKPKYLLIDLDQESLIYDLTEEEKLEIASKRILRQYRPTFKELPKF